jgi:hypothetical protein
MELLKVYGNVFCLIRVMCEAVKLSIEQMPKKVYELDLISFANYCKDNFKYLADNKEQIVKTWQNAEQTKTIDCKTFSVFTKAYFALNMKPAKFIFLGKEGSLKHVAVLYEENGKIFVVDLLTKEIIYTLQNYLEKYKFSDTLIV